MTGLTNHIQTLVDGTVGKLLGGGEPGSAEVSRPGHPDVPGADPRTGGENLPGTSGKGNEHDNGWHGNNKGGGNEHDNGWHGNNGQNGPGGSNPNMNTGGSLPPQGMQDVPPGIAQQITNNLFSVVDTAGALARNTLEQQPSNAPPTSASSAAAQAAAQASPGQGALHANAHAEAGLANGRAVGQGGSPPGTAQGTPGPGAMGRGAPAAMAGAPAANPAGATFAGQAPGTAAAGTAFAGQAAAPGTAANTPTLAATLAQQQAALAAQLRPGADAAQLAQNRAADAALAARPDAALAGRIATALQPGQALQATNPAATLPAPPPGTTTATAATSVPGLTMAQAATTPPPVDARGMLLAANEHAGSRVETLLALAGHTLDGLLRRPLRGRMRTMPQGLARLLWAMGMMGAPTTRDGEAAAERDIQRVMQWLFWMLAVIAYGCLGVALVALVGSNGHMFRDVAAGRSYTAWLALFGLVTGTFAWWVARRLSRRH